MENAPRKVSQPQAAVVDKKIRPEVPFDLYAFPFENVVFEGGSGNLLAYVGAIRVSIPITHSHGSARVFSRRRSKSMEKAKIRPLATPKPLNRSSPKLAWVTTSWTSFGTLNFIALPLGVFGPHIRDFPYEVVFNALWVLATRYSLHP